MKIAGTSPSSSPTPNWRNKLNPFSSKKKPKKSRHSRTAASASPKIDDKDSSDDSFVIDTASPSRAGDSSPLKKNEDTKAASRDSPLYPASESKATSGMEKIGFASSPSSTSVGSVSAAKTPWGDDEDSANTAEKRDLATSKWTKLTSYGDVQKLVETIAAVFSINDKDAEQLFNWVLMFAPFVKENAKNIQHVHDLEQALSSVKTDNEALKTDNEALQAQTGTLEQQIEKLKQELSEAQDEIKSLLQSKNENVDQSKEIDNKKHEATISKLEWKIGMLMQENDRLMNDSTIMEKRYKELKETNKELLKDICKV